MLLTLQFNVLACPRDRGVPRPARALRTPSPSYQDVEFLFGQSVRYPVSCLGLVVVH